MTDNPFQYVISLPLTLIIVITVLHIQLTWFEFIGIGQNHALWVGLFIFIGVMYGCFYLGDTIISRIEEKRNEIYDR